MRPTLMPVLASSSDGRLFRFRRPFRERAGACSLVDPPPLAGVTMRIPWRVHQSPNPSVLAPGCFGAKLDRRRLLPNSPASRMAGSNGPRDRLGAAKVSSHAEHDAGDRGCEDDRR
jgi:hypothetical protein